MRLPVGVKTPLLLASIAVCLMVLVAPVRAIPYGSGDYGTCIYEGSATACSITITTSGTVSLSVTPTSSGVYTTASDNVTVGTNASTGYTLTLRDTDTSTNLTSGADTIAPSAGTQALPVVRALGTWGYRVDGIGGFGAGPTSAESNVSSSSYTFAGVPASSQSANTIASSANAANPAVVTKVWYGVRLDTTTPSGVYTDQVVYTATTNP